MPTFIWHIDGAAVIFDWEFADLSEAQGGCLLNEFLLLAGKRGLFE